MDLMEFDRSMTLGDLVTRYPSAADVFKEYRIDFCCGGNRPYAEVLKEHNLSEEEVTGQLLAVLQKPSAKEEDWAGASFSSLIDHIVNVHHGYLYKTLPVLEQYAHKIENVHGANHPELSDVRRLFVRMSDELLHHLPAEEEGMFPAIRKLEQEPSEREIAQCAAMVETLEDEHEACGDILKEIRRITGDYSLPGDACATYSLTYQKLQELESDLFQHIHLENNILFPRVLGMAG